LAAVVPTLLDLLDLDIQAAVNRFKRFKDLGPYLVSTSVAQAGMEGSSAQKPPSSALWTITRFTSNLIVEMN
jgi:hypothetical protein